MFLYTLGKIILSLIFKVLFPLKVKGLKNFPEKGPVILVANHCSYFDPLYLAIAVSRKVNWIILRPYYELRWLKWVFKSINSFPVNIKGPNISAIKYALDILGEDEVLGIFPEGGRSKDGKLQKGKLGAALIALKSRAPILPVAIQGAFNVFPPQAILPRPYRWAKVQIGFPLYLDLAKTNNGFLNKETLQKATEQIMGSLKKLIEECKE